VIDTEAIWVCPSCQGVWRNGTRAQRWHRKYENERSDKLRVAARRERHRLNQRRYIQSHPDRVREIQRRYRQSVQADPDRRARHNAVQRINYRLRAGRPVRPGAADEPYRQAPTRSEWLDPRPFLDWLAATFPDAYQPDLARKLRLDLKTLTNVLERRHAHVCLSVVDRALTAVGRPDLLNDLYPMP
jgi:hypothetical protein